MLQYIIRRLVLAFPTLVVISIIVFLLLDLAPGDPTSQLPLTIPPELRENIRESLGFNDPIYERWWNWFHLMVVNEPIALIDDNRAEADDAMDQLEALASGDARASVYAQALRRFVFRRAVGRHRSVRDAGADANDILEAAERVVAAGRPLLGDAPDLSEPALLTAALSLAEALDDVALYGASPGFREEALDLRLAALELRPADAELLGAVARSADSTPASYSESPSSACQRARRAAGSSGSRADSAARSSSLTRIRGRSGSGK